MLLVEPKPFFGLSLDMDIGVRDWNPMDGELFCWKIFSAFGPDYGYSLKILEVAGEIILNHFLDL